MATAVRRHYLPLAYAGAGEYDHDVLRALLELPGKWWIGHHRGVRRNDTTSWYGA
jgi:hypothetical protein